MITESYRNRMIRLCGILQEDFKSQAVAFESQGIDKDIVDKYISAFRQIKDKKYKQLFDDIHGVKVPRDKRHDIDSYKTFHELELVVDYVKSQTDVSGAALGTSLEIDGEPIFNNDIFEVYYADSPRACIQYRGNIPYGWCISKKDVSNMYYTYRLKEYEPAFYFVKIKDRTKKELGFFNMAGNVFSGTFKDKYHFFVLQTVKNANIENTSRVQYYVTSAMNDGDKEMSWNDILSIEPRLKGMQELFEPKPLSAEEREIVEKYKNGIDNETYCKLEYAEKRRYLDVYVKLDKLLTDEQFYCTPDDLKNLYIGFGVALSENQIELIKNNSKLMKRYVNICDKMFDEFLKKQNFKFEYTQLQFINQSKFANLDWRGIKYLLQYSKEPEKVMSMLLNNQQFIENLDSRGIYYLLEYCKEPEKVMSMLLNNQQFIENLDLKGIYYLLKNSKESERVINLLLNNQQFIANLDSDRIEYLLRYSKEPERVMNLLLSNSQFIENLDTNGIMYLLEYSKEPERVMNLLLSNSQFIENLDSDGIRNLLMYSKEPEKVMNLLGNKGQQFIANLDSYRIEYLLRYSEEPKKIKSILRKANKLQEQLRRVVREIVDESLKGCNN